MKMNQIETLTSKKFNKGVIYFPEYFFINNEKNFKYILMKANFLRKKFKVSKFILIGYFDQDEIKKFLANEIFETLEDNKKNKINSFQDYFDNEEFHEEIEKFDFQFALIDYVNLDNLHKLLGNSSFFLAIGKDSKIIFSTKKYYFRYLLGNIIFVLILSMISLFVFFPSVESMIFIE